MSDIATLLKRHRRALRLFLWLAALTSMAAIVHTYIPAGNTSVEYPEFSDYYKFYLSAERKTQGESMYWQMPARLHAEDPCSPQGRWRETQNKKNHSRPFDPVLDCLHPNLNPPAFVAFTLPFSWLPFEVSWWAWAGTSALCGLLSIWLIVNAYTPHKALVPLRFAISCAAFFGYYPTYINFCYGQVTLLLLLPLTLSWHAMRHGRDVRSGIWMGVAAAIKPFFGLFVITYFLARKGKAAAALAATAATIALFGLMWAGLDTHLEYMKVLGDISWTATNWNASFTGFFSRLLGGSENISWIQAPDIAKLLTTLCAACVLIASASRLKRIDHSQSSQSCDALYTVSIPAMLLITPLGWLYYFPWLCICAPTLWRYCKSTKNQSITHVILAATTTVTAIPRLFESANSMNSRALWLWDGPLYFYMLLVLFALSLQALEKASSKTHSID